MTTTHQTHRVKSPAVLTMTFLQILFFCSTLTAQPRNVIVFIGDGAGPEHLKAGRMYLGGPLSYDSFPYSGELRTYSANNAITDSAAAATAMATGIKVNNGVLSIAQPGDGSELMTLLELYKAMGKSVGLVTTTFVTHATPAAFGAHELSRNNYNQIAQDYLNQTRPHLLFGGGGNGIAITSAQSAGYTVVTDRKQLFTINTENTGMLSGQFGTYHLPYEYDGLGGLPHLSEMTQVALDILDNDPDGMFLMVEGGRIDHASHDNDEFRMVDEVAEFSNSVQVAIDWAAGRNDTLILVGADHETGGLMVVQDNGPGICPYVVWSTVGHTATNVPVFAWGLNAQLVDGVMNNTYVFDVAIASEASNPVPPSPSTDVPLNAVLAWSGGSTAVSHDVYLGTNFDAVRTADHSSPEYMGNQGDLEYSAGPLLPETTYFWSADAVDSRGGVIPGPVWSFTTAGGNSPPVATNDAYNGNENEALVVAAPGVLGNDTDADGDPLQALLVGNPSNGVLTLNTDGSFTYTPNAGFSGSDSFSYRAGDGVTESGPATVAIAISPAATTDAYVISDPLITYGNLTGGSAGIEGTRTELDGLVQSISEGPSGKAGASSLEVEYTLHTSASRSEVTAFELHLDAIWVPGGDIDPLIVSIWNGSAWQDISTEAMSDGVFVPATDPWAYVDAQGDIRVRFTDSAATKQETKDTLTIDLLYARIEAGAPVDHPPTAPAGLAATPGDMQVTLDWNDNSEADLAGYNVYRAENAGGPYAKLTGARVPDSQYVDTTAVNGTRYFYVVTAVDTASHESEQSAEISVTPAQQSNLHVADIAMQAILGKKSYVVATVRIHDTNGATVSGATVVGSWLVRGLVAKETVTAVTDGSGAAVFESASKPVRSGETYTFAVLDVARDGFVYNASDNVESQDSVSFP